MVVALGPGKFYGSGLPRPRIYSNVQFNDERIDPPLPVLDPLMSWAEEAHWSMGGLRLKRLRLQGRIEGSVKKLRAEREKFLKNRKQSTVVTNQIGNSPNGSSSKNTSPSPPPAPMALKRRRFMDLIHDDDDHDHGEVDQQLVRDADEEGVGDRVRRKSARKLKNDFDRVASQSRLEKSRGSPEKNLRSGAVALRTRSRGSSKENSDGTYVVDVEALNRSDSKANGKAKSERGGENGASTTANLTRTSPRLAKRG